jgi:hypothetical protein
MSKSSQYCKSVNITKSISKPSCKVCIDAGLNDQATQHWVRNTQGKVICPTLLGQECRYCFEKGHTVKYCPKNKATTQTFTKKNIITPVAKPKPIVSSARSTPTNRYAILVDDDDDDMVFLVKASKPKNVVEVEEYPQLVPRSQIPIAPTLAFASYASKVKTEPVPVPKPAVKPALEIQPLLRPTTPSTPTTPPPQIRPYKKYTNWADWSDSDSDDDE